MNVAKRPTAARLDDRAAAALLSGAVGLFLFNVLFGPLAIVLGTIAVRRSGPGRLGRAAALLGIFLGIADLVVLVILVVSRVHDGRFDWHLGR
jgi:hypothetical protein